MFDVVFLDFVMNIMHGPETANNLRHKYLFKGYDNNNKYNNYNYNYNNDYNNNNSKHNNDSCKNIIKDVK